MCGVFACPTLGDNIGYNFYSAMTVMLRKGFSAMHFSKYDYSSCCAFSGPRTELPTRYHECSFQRALG